MTFLVSPGILIREFDLTTTIPAIAETPAAFAGVFKWGPAEQRILIGSEGDLLARFGPPSDFNGETWFTMSSFLAYGGFSYVVRALDTAGNTVIGARVGANASDLSMQAGNNHILVNTAGMAVGMKLFHSNTTALNPTDDGGVYITAVNSTAITVSVAPSQNVANIQLFFRTNIAYNAMAMEVLDYVNQWADFNVYNPTDYTNKDGLFDPEILYVAKWPGAMGNSLRVAVCDSPSQWSSNINLAPNNMIDANNSYILANIASNTMLVQVTPTSPSVAGDVTAANVVAGQAQAALTIGDLVEAGNSNIGFQFMKITAISNVTVNVSTNVFSFTLGTENPYFLHANVTSNTIERFWEFYNKVRVAPGQSDWVFNNGNNAANDELHVVVADEGGAFTGDPGAVLEIFPSMSRATDAKNHNNTGNYYKDVINRQSQYIWWADDRAEAPSNTAPFVQSSVGNAPLNIQFILGDDGLDEENIELGALIKGYNYYFSAEDVDISLIMVGKGRGLPIDSNTQLATWLINNIAEVRKDCIVLCSPDIGYVVNNKGFEADDIANARNSMPSTSYGVMDSGYKYMYDRYNDVYRWVPLNGDIAGLCAQTDMTNAPWWSPAGFNRGNIKNVVQLAWNPKEPDRDTLYSNDVNPVVQFRDMGTILYGDKTLFHKPSAFNRINVRRLFIVLEKAIATAAKFTLFEFNDEFTRSQFKAMVNPFLKQIQGQRGITGFFVRCDQTNNTPWIIQNNEFVADIFIRPNYSINWILLNFINVPPTLSFAEAEAVQF